MKSDLTIIIVTYNSSEIIENCLNEIDFGKYRTIIVDNNSSDSTITLVKKKYPKAEVIELDNNIGYGRGNNIALSKTTTSYALILNPDAIIKEKDIELALNKMRDNPDFALVNPKSSSQKSFINERRETAKKEFTYSDFVGGGFLFMNMDIFRKIGFFDEEIFMFAEDNEICQRSIDSGYKNVIINNARAYHLDGQSSKKTLGLIYKRNWHMGWSKSHYRKRRKNYISSKRSTLRLAILHLFKSIVSLFKFDVKGFTKNYAFCSGCFSSLIGLKAFKKNGKARG